VGAVCGPGNPLTQGHRAVAPLKVFECHADHGECEIQPGKEDVGGTGGTMVGPCCPVPEGADRSLKPARWF